MTAPPEPGGWELHRALETIQTTLTRTEERMVPRPEFEAHKTETDRRLGALEATKSAAHEVIHQKIAEGVHDGTFMVAGAPGQRVHYRVFAVRGAGDLDPEPYTWEGDLLQPANEVETADA